MKVLVLIVLFPVWVLGQSKETEPFPPLNKIKMVPVEKEVWFGEDKAKHLLGSFVLTGAVVYYFRHNQKWSNENSIAFGAGLTFSMGLAKEIKDSRSSDHFFSWKDVVADLAGIGLGVVFLSWW